MTDIPTFPAIVSISRGFILHNSSSCGKGRHPRRPSAVLAAPGPGLAGWAINRTMTVPHRWSVAIKHHSHRYSPLGTDRYGLKFTGLRV